MVIYVVGHKSPDMDSVCSAIGVSYLKTKLGTEAWARVSENVDEETAFVLEKFGIGVPDVLTDAKDKDIILVDHTELDQAVAGMHEANIVGIVDHHNLGDVHTDVPPEVLIRPLGSTCTIVKDLFDYFRVDIPKNIAGIMLCAILSDTVIFKSPTTTEEDKRVAYELAGIANVPDVEGLGLEIFRVRSKIDGASPEHLVMRDYKDYEMEGKKIGIGQLELCDVESLNGIKQGLVDEIKKLKGEGRYAVFLMLTDILKQGTQLLSVSDDPDLEKKVFGDGENGWFQGMLSRKKQVVPKLEEYFEDAV